VVKILLTAREENAAELAVNLGWSRSVLYSRQNGTTGFLAKDVWKLADYFRVPIQVFYGGPAALSDLLRGKGQDPMTGYYPELLGHPADVDRAA
jgi:hypothetical protein